MKQKVVLLIFFCLALVSCATSPEITRGDRFSKEGNWDDAVESYREAVKKNPQDADLQARFTQAKIRSAALHYLKGVELSKAKSYDEAISEIRKSVNLDPSRVEYQTGLIRATRLKESEEQFRTGQTLLKAGRLEQAEEAFGKAAALNPENEAAKEALVSVGVALEAIRDEGSGLSLKSSQPITLKFHNARIKEVFELLSKTAGINILFDKDVRDDNITIFIKDASFKETLNLILATNSLFMKKISDDTILIIPKNKQKVDQYQDLMIRTFYLSAVKTEDMVALLQKMLEIRKIQANKELNAITIRETPDKIKLAEKIIEANDRKPPEVMLELEVLEVQDSGELKYGFTFPSNQIGAQMGGTTTNAGVTTFQPGIIDLATLKNLNDQAFQFILPSVYLDFLKTDSNAKTLANPKVRILDGKKAVINIGDKIPILLSSTIAPAMAGSVVQPTTSTNTEFKDVGIKVTAEPTIHLNNEITLKLDLEVSSLGNQIDLGGGVKQYTFGQRVVNTFLNLRDGETGVLGGLLRDDTTNTENKIPGLGDIPLLGFFFSGTDKTKKKQEVILTITPHILHGLETPAKELQAFWSGTEESYSTKPLFADFPTTGDVKRENEKGTAPLLPPPPAAAPPSIPPSGQTDPSGQSVVSVVSPVNPVLANQEFQVSVNIAGASALSDAVLSFNYDPLALDLKQAVEGNFLKGDGKQTSFVTSVNAVTGMMEIHIQRVADQEGRTGGGTLATLTFLAKKKGDPGLVLRDAKLLNPGKSDVPAKLENANFKIQ